MKIISSRLLKLPPQTQLNVTWKCGYSEPLGKVLTLFSEIIWLLIIWYKPASLCRGIPWWSQSFSSKVMYSWGPQDWNKATVWWGTISVVGHEWDSWHILYQWEGWPQRPVSMPVCILWKPHQLFSNLGFSKSTQNGVWRLNRQPCNHIYFFFGRDIINSHFDLMIGSWSMFSRPVAIIRLFL